MADVKNEETPIQGSLRGESSPDEAQEMPELDEAQEAVEDRPIERPAAKELPTKLDLDGDLKEIEVTLKVNGKKVACVLREMTGPQREAFEDLLQKRTKYSTQGRPMGLRNGIGIEKELLIRSLIGPDGKYVTPDFLTSLSATATGKLVESAILLSGIMGATSRMVDEAKNG